MRIFPENVIMHVIHSALMTVSVKISNLVIKQGKYGFLSNASMPQTTTLK